MIRFDCYATICQGYCILAVKEQQEIRIKRHHEVRVLRLSERYVWWKSKGRWMRYGRADWNKEGRPYQHGCRIDNKNKFEQRHFVQDDWAPA